MEVSPEHSGPWSSLRLLPFAQICYKEAGKEALSRPLYHQLAHTPEARFVQELTHVQSTVGGVPLRHRPSVCVLPPIIRMFCLCFQNKYKEDGVKSLCESLYSQLPETAELQFAKSVSDLQSQVSLSPGSSLPAHLETAAHTPTHTL